ncbi:MAG TPA: hypothetical protein PKD85_18395 [Saprospiraceae bacterium]|nr:hypothetical protein [Saprospiraceae bacterium]
MYDHYLPILISALTVLIIGCWNPEALQSRKNGMPSGHPSYMMLALFALLAGLLSCYLMHGPGGKKMKGYMSI